MANGMGRRMVRMALGILPMAIPLPAFAMDPYAMTFFLVSCAVAVLVPVAAGLLAWWRVSFWDALVWTLGGGAALALVLALLLSRESIGEIVVSTIAATIVGVIPLSLWFWICFLIARRVRAEREARHKNEGERFY